jgi:hypothetical protein
MSALNQHAVTLLVYYGGVDMNTAAATLLYTVPSGMSLVIDHIVIKTPTATLDTASFSFGYNNPNYNDVITDGTHGLTLTGNDSYNVLPIDDGAKIGISTEGFYIIINTPQGIEAEASFDIFGYLT